jgi:hypothetical protein
MEAQTMINAGLGLIAFMGGWILRNLQESMKSLRDSDEKLAAKVQAIEVLVAGTYIKRDDFDKTIIALFAKLDKIETKLDGKANRSECPNVVHQ